MPCKQHQPLREIGRLMSESPLYDDLCIGISGQIPRQPTSWVLWGGNYLPKGTGFYTKICGQSIA